MFNLFLLVLFTYVLSWKQTTTTSDFMLFWNVVLVPITQTALAIGILIVTDYNSVVQKFYHAAIDFTRALMYLHIIGIAKFSQME